MRTSQPRTYFLLNPEIRDLTVDNLFFLFVDIFVAKRTFLLHLSIFGGTSVLIGKHFQLENSNFYERITSFLIQYQITRKNSRSEFSDYQFLRPLALEKSTIFLISTSFIASKPRDVAHLSMSISEVIREPCCGDSPIVTLVTAPLNH